MSELALRFIKKKKFDPWADPKLLVDGDFLQF